MSSGRHAILSRIVTPVLASIPCILLIWYVMGKARLDYMPDFFAVLLPGVALVYFLSDVLRAIEESIREGLVGKWGGRPESILLSHENDEVDGETKALIYYRIKTDFGICLMCKEDSGKYPRQAELLIDGAASRVIKATCARTSPVREMLARRLTFAANLAAGFSVFCVFSVLLLAVSAYHLISGEHGGSAVMFVLALDFVVVGAVLRLYLLPKVMRHAAFRHARSVFDEYLQARDLHPRT